MSPVPEKKIYIDSRDDAAVVVDKVIQTPATRIVLSIPSGAAFGSSVKDFQILNRESRTAGKEVIVESADARTLELASLSDLGITKATGRKKERAISDIVPRSSLPPKTPVAIFKKEEKEDLPVLKKPAIPKPSPRKEAASFPTPPFWEKSKNQESASKTIYPVFPPEMGIATGHTEVPAVSVPETTEPAGEREFTPKKRWKLFLWGGITVAVLILGWFLSFRVFARAEITLELRKNVVNFAETVQAGTKVAAPQLGNPLMIPAELMVKKANLTEAFPASGREKVVVKARGKLVVFNAYSSAPQSIVQNTRFVSPEGRVFRLDEKTTIPGAKVENGKIVPSSIEVSVTADAAGETYNVPASANWKIPGFEGSPKFVGFYGEARAPIKGGFIGEQAVATDADTAAAKEKIRGDLESALRGQMVLLETFKLIDGASRFRMLSEEVTPDSQDPTKMNILAEAELTYIVFDEEMLKDAVAKKTREKAKEKLSGELRVRSFTFTYKDIQPNFGEGVLVSGMTGTIEFEPVLDPLKIAQELKGKNNDEFRAYANTLGSYISRGDLVFFPHRWVGRVPDDVGKIKVILK